MTVALGILAGGAHILAADKQMTSGYDKFGEGKIYRRWNAPNDGFPAGVVMIAGAGDEFLLRALQNDIADEFSRNKTESMSELEESFRTVLTRFYRNYVAITPQLDQRPEVEAIISARRGQFSSMWVTKRNRIMQAQSPVAVGIGAPRARSLLSELCLPQQMDTAALLAAYVVFMVESTNLWVGMGTHVICSDDSLAPFPTGLDELKCRKLEEVFRAYGGVGAKVLHRILGSDYEFCGADRIAEDIECLRRLIHPIKEAYSDKSRT